MTVPSLASSSPVQFLGVSLCPGTHITRTPNRSVNLSNIIGTNKQSRRKKVLDLRTNLQEFELIYHQQDRQLFTLISDIQTHVYSEQTPFNFI